MSITGDWNRDGIDDFVVSVQTASGEGKPSFGIVRVYSTADGTEIALFRGNPRDFRFGEDVDGTADLDGDGAFDLLVRTRWAGDDPEDPEHRWPVVSAISGESRKTMYEFRGIGGVAIGDLNGDGGSDFVVMAGSQGEERGRVLVLSGKTGQELGVLRREGRVAMDVHPMGDLDGDKIPDFAVSWSPIVEEKVVKSRGLVAIVSGREFSTLWETSTREDASSMGRDMAGGVDLNGDGTPDVMLIESQLRWRDPAPNVGAKMGMRGHRTVSSLRALSGRDGSVLWERESGPDAEGWFSAVCMLEGGWSGEGPVVLLGQPGWTGSNEDHFTARGCVWVLDGKSGAERLSIHGRIPGSGFGAEVFTLRSGSKDVPRQALVAAPSFTGGNYTIYRSADSDSLKQIWMSK